MSRLACGHYGSATDDTRCDDPECDGNLPDLWEIAGGEVNPARLTETRAYRTTKFRMINAEREGWA